MEKIFISTIIYAPVEICFDLSRSIDFHKETMKHSGEKAIAGVTEGLIGLDEEVTWEAIHLGISQQLTSKITRFDYPYYFKDEMVNGIFKVLKHDHYFKSCGSFTIMKDVFEFEAPLGLLGRLVSRIFLKSYLKKLLKARNKEIKQAAESGIWEKYLHYSCST